MRRERRVKPLVRRIIVVLFLVFVPFWVLAYILCYNYYTSENCRNDWENHHASDVKSFRKTSCLFRSTKIFAILELNPLINIYTRSRILKNDLMPQKYVNETYELLAFMDYVFTKYHIPILGYKKWGLRLRIGVFFPHFCSNLSFKMAWLINNMRIKSRTGLRRIKRSF